MFAEPCAQNHRRIGYAGAIWDLLRAAPRNVEAAMLNKSALSFALILVGISALPLCASCAVAQDKVWRIGFLDHSVPPTAAAPSRNLEAFRQGLAGLGYLDQR